MVRVPNSINSKNGKIVQVVESWNGVRPAANPMLFWFQIHLASEKFRYDLKHDRGLYKAIASGKEYKISLRRSEDSPRTIHWIDSAILEGSGIGDYRKITIDLVLAPYLINVRKYDQSTAYNTIADWLDKCMRIRRLDFNANSKIRYALKHAKDGPVPYPMRQDTMREKYPRMYLEIFGRSEKEIV
jgi:hypothetical protein